MKAHLVFSLALFATQQVVAAGVAAALERGALTVRQPERAVLLGAAQAGPRIVAVGERGIVALSEDGGRQWRQASVPVSVTLTAVRFADKDHGYALGHGGTVLATADGGQTWSRRLDGRQLAQLLLAAAQSSGDAAVLKSAQRLVAEGPDKPLFDLLVFDARRVLVVGAYGLALFTQDGGATWATWSARLENPKELHLYAVRQRGQRIVIAGEQGLVLHSVDGGQSFKRLSTPYGGSYFTAELPEDQAIVLAGLRGNVWRSTDDGASWTQVASPVPVSITASATGPNGQPLFANQAGMVLRLAGGTLQPLSAGVLPPLNFLLPLDGARVLALTVQGAQRVDLRTPDEARKGQSQ